MLGNKGNVSAGNITIENLYKIWVHKLNVSEYRNPAMIVTPREIVVVR